MGLIFREKGRFAKGNSYWLGKKRSKETNEKISNTKKGTKPWNFGKTSKDFPQLSHFGIKRSVPAWNKGKPCSETTKLKISLANKGKRIGKNSHSWKGGVSKIDKLVRRLKEYLQWRSDCFERDKWTCQSCGFRGGYVTVHHMKSLHKIIVENNIKDINEARKCKELWDINNGVTLCEKCHSLTDNYRGRANNKKTNNK